LRRLLWQGSWRGNTGRRSGATGTSRIGPYRRPLLLLCFHPSACLVIDGKVVAFAEEERFSRRKHHKDSRSCAVAAAYCLSEAGITLAGVDEIAIAFNPAWPTPSDICMDAELIAELLDPALFGHHRPRQVTVVEHHLAHAVSAFHLGGFDEAAVLVVDGSGDGVFATLAHGTADGLKVLCLWNSTQFPISSIRFPSQTFEYDDGRRLRFRPDNPETACSNLRILAP